MVTPPPQSSVYQVIDGARQLKRILGTLDCITIPENLQPRDVSIIILNRCIHSSHSSCKWGSERQRCKFVDIDGVVGVFPKDSGIYRRVTGRYMPERKSVC